MKEKFIDFIEFDKINGVWIWVDLKILSVT